MITAPAVVGLTFHSPLRKCSSATDNINQCDLLLVPNRWNSDQFQRALQNCIDERLVAIIFAPAAALLRHLRANLCFILQQAICLRKSCSRHHHQCHDEIVRRHPPC